MDAFNDVRMEASTTCRRSSDMLNLIVLLFPSKGNNSTQGVLLDPWKTRFKQQHNLVHLVRMQRNILSFVWWKFNFQVLFDIA